MKHGLRPIIVLMAFSIAMPAVSAQRCDVRATRIWQSDHSKPFTVDAFSSGPDCSNAVVSLVIRSKTGKPEFWFSSPAADLAAFTTINEKPIANSKAMKAALEQWIGLATKPILDGFDKLPDWKAGDAGPTQSEFPFRVNDAITRDDYIKWRKSKRALFCFVQGMESANCLIVNDSGSIIEVGIQSFPG